MGIRLQAPQNLMSYIKPKQIMRISESWRKARFVILMRCSRDLIR